MIALGRLGAASSAPQERPPALWSGRYGTLFVLLLLLSGCVIDRTRQSASYRWQQRIDTTVERQRDLERDLGAEQRRLDDIAASMDEARRRLAEGGATLEGFIAELQALRGEIAGMRNQQGDGQRRVEDLDAWLVSVDVRVARIEQQLGLAPSAPTPVPSPAATTVAPGPATGTAATHSGPGAGPSTPAPEAPEVVLGAPPAPTEAEDLVAMVTGGKAPTTTSADDAAFADALMSIKAEEWDKAGSKLARYQKKFPQGRYAVQAQYLVARCWFELGKFKVAVQEFEKVASPADGAPDPLWAPRAMWMQGLSFVELGTNNDLVAARLFLSELVAAYPDSEEAKKARKKLEQLK